MNGVMNWGYQDVVDVLIANGFTDQTSHKNTGGSHHYFVDEGSRHMVVVPYHSGDSIRPKTLVPPNPYSPGSNAPKTAPGHSLATVSYTRYAIAPIKQSGTTFGTSSSRKSTGDEALESIILTSGLPKKYWLEVGRLPRRKRKKTPYED